MCSFGSCKTRFEFLSQFRKIRNASECFVTQVQTRLPKTKCVWPMKINVICTVLHHNHNCSLDTRTTLTKLGRHIVVIMVRPVIPHSAGMVVGYWRNGCSYRNITR